MCLFQVFLGDASNPDVIAYHASLSFGSSDSPVFNSSGALVATHTASVDGNGESAAGYAVSLKSIIRDVLQMKPGRHAYM